MSSSEKSDPSPQSDPSPPSDTSEKSGWYPGKFIGIKKKEEKDEKGSGSGSGSGSGLGLGFDRDREGSNESTEDEKVKESMISSTIRSIREKYLERQLIGRIYLYRLSGVISTAVTSDVTADDVMQHLLKKVEVQGRDSFLDNDPLMQAELTGQYKRALSTVDTILNSLERRSLSYTTADFAHTTLLTRGTTIGISDPFFGLIGFSFTLELSATVHTLLAARRRYEIARDLVLERQKREEEERENNRESTVSVTSSLSRISFPFSKSSPQLNVPNEKDLS